MNHIYRIVWNRARGAFVVAHERARGLGGPTRTVAGVACVGLMSLAAPSHAGHADYLLLDGSQDTVVAEQETAPSVCVGTWSHDSSPYCFGGPLVGSLLIEGTIENTADDMLTIGNILGRLEIGETGQVLDGEGDAFHGGIDIGDIDGGTFIHAGTIRVDNDDRSGEGIYAGHLNGLFKIEKTGLVDVDLGSGYGVGVDFAEIEPAGVFIQAGTIMVDVVNLYEEEIGIRMDNSYAWGVYTDGYSPLVSTSAVFEHSGTTSAKATSVYGEAQARGVEFGGTVESGGALINTGTISAESNAAYRSEAVGVLTRDGEYIRGDLHHAGEIRAVATSEQLDAEAIGMDIDIASPGAVRLSAGSTVTAEATAVSAEAYGLKMSYLGGWLGGGELHVEDGATITATATGDGIGRATSYGIWIDSVDIGSRLVNAGTITARADEPDQAWALRVEGLTDIGSLADNGIWNSGTLDGGVWIYSQGPIMDGDPDEPSCLMFCEAIPFTNAGSIRLPVYDVWDWLQYSITVGADFKQTGQGELVVRIGDSERHSRLGVTNADFVGSNVLRVELESDYVLQDGDRLENVLFAMAWGDWGEIGEDWLPKSVAAGTGLPILSEGEILAPDGFVVRDHELFWDFEAVLNLEQVGNDPIEPGAAIESVDLIARRVTEQQVAAGMGGPVLQAGTAQMSVQHVALGGEVIGARLGAQRGLASGDAGFTDRVLWLKPFGTEDEQSDRGGVAGYESSTRGLVLGIDGEFNADWRLGVAATLASGSASRELPSTGHRVAAETYAATLYAARNLDDHTTLDLQFGGGVTRYDSTRTMYQVPATAEAEHGGWNARAGARLTRTYGDGGATTWLPHLRADYQHVVVDGYTEHGAGIYNLDVTVDRLDALVVAAGSGVEQRVGDALTLFGHIEVGYDLLGGSTALDASFVSGGGIFTTDSIDPDPLRIRAGLGARLLHGEGVELLARYDVEARDDYLRQDVSLNLAWSY